MRRAPTSASRRTSPRCSPTAAPAWRSGCRRGPGCPETPPHMALRSRHPLPRRRAETSCAPRPCRPCRAALCPVPEPALSFSVPVPRSSPPTRMWHATPTAGTPWRLWASASTWPRMPASRWGRGAQAAPPRGSAAPGAGLLGNQPRQSGSCRCSPGPRPRCWAGVACVPHSLAR